MALIALVTAVRTQWSERKEPVLDEAVLSGAAYLRRMAERAIIVAWVPDDHELDLRARGRTVFLPIHIMELC
jgi:hypothetical protein